jgi:hypothetical protein
MKPVARSGGVIVSGFIDAPARAVYGRPTAIGGHCEHHREQPHA